MKIQKIAAELADKVKRLDMKELTKSLLLRHWAELVLDLAE